MTGSEIEVKRVGIPEVFLPNSVLPSYSGLVNTDKSPGLVIAENLDGLRSPTSVLPGLGGKPYARFVMVYPPKKVNVKIPIISFSGTNLEEAARLVDRGFQRAKQFQKIDQISTRWGAQLSKGLRPTFFFIYESAEGARRSDYEVTHELLERFLRIVNSFYDKELSTDPFTKELTQLTIEERRSMETAAVREAERIHFEKRYKNATDIFTSREEIICETQNVAKKPAKPVEQASVPQDTSITSTPAKKHLDVEAVLEAVEKILRPPDFPNRGASKYIRNLWDRPF